MDKKIIEVVAGVLMRPDGGYMLGSRPEGKPYAGYWEFPGGKVEAGESFEQALARELEEEMGIHVLRASYWLTRVHHYEHASVRLRFFRVWEWQGVPSPLEGQRFAWVWPGEAALAPMLPANGPILKALTLPTLQVITRAAEVGPAVVLARLEAPDAPAWVQVREPQMSREQLQAFCAEVGARVHAYGGRVVVNADPAWLKGWPVDGVHLNAGRLAGLRVRPDLEWVGASVHDAAGLRHAGEMELDYVLLGDVRAAAHPAEHPTLGWGGFAVTVQTGAPLPVYAQGGMRPDDVDQARAFGAHGVALSQGVWL